MSTILATSLGSVAADIAIKSLRQLGHRVVGTDIYPKEFHVESYEVNAFYQSPYVNDISYREHIEDICTKENVKYIFPLTDVDVDFFNDHRQWFIDHHITVCISPKYSLNIIRDKKKLQDFTRMKCPKIKSIPTMRLKDMKKLEWDFPLVCKPKNGRSSQGLRYIYSMEEWESFRKCADQDSYIVEPYISGPIVMVEIVRDSVHHKVVAIPRQELIATPHGCGTTVRMYHDEQLEEDSVQLAEALDIVGCVNFEYIRHTDDAYYLVECNPRFSAGVEFSCMAGYNCIANHLACFSRKKIDDYTFHGEMVIARKYEEYVTAIKK